MKLFDLTSVTWLQCLNWGFVHEGPKVPVRTQGTSYVEIPNAD